VDLSDFNRYTVVTNSGFVSFVNLNFPIALGGIRLIQDVSVKEVELLALSMQMKLATFNLPISGAKAGCLGIPNDLEMLTQFIREIKELLKGISYNEFKKLSDFDSKSNLENKFVNYYQLITGPDIGVSEDLFHQALIRNKLNNLARKGLLAQIHPKYQLPIDNLATALGVIVSSEEIFRVLFSKTKNEDPLHHLNYVLEGFGKVGTGIATLLQHRANLIGFSNIHGCVITDVNSDFCTSRGFEVKRLLELYSKFGDEFILKLGLPILPHEELFNITANLLIPGARTEVITKDIAISIVQAGIKAIVPASNFPYTQEALSLLEAEVVCFPDFIANAGAVIGAMIEISENYPPKDQIDKVFDLVHSAIAFETRDLLIQVAACKPNNVQSNFKGLYQTAINRAVKREKSLVKEFMKNEIELTLKFIAQNVIARYLM
jgi:glutamate dehydrogenase (NAD(P)+)